MNRIFSPRQLSPRAVVALVASMCFAVSSAHAGEPPLQASFEGSSVVAWQAADTARVEVYAAGIRSFDRSLALPPGAQLDSVAATTGGFLLAGSAITADGGRSIFVLQGSADDPDRESFRRLPPLPVAAAEARVREQPVLLSDGGTLAGIAWLEGPSPQAMEVRAARWDGERWRRVEQVSAGAPGEQIALTGTVLNDGSWLLAWTRFDGEDDETVYAWRLADEWSAPRRVGEDNGVPDIVPALAAVPGGALLAWSRYDGNDYRLMTARFAGGAWSPPRWSGPAGSVFPSFADAGSARGAGATQQGASRTLLYRTAAPRGWTVVELDSEGVPLRHAKIVSPGSARPSFEIEADGVRFLWPGRKKASAVARWDAATGESEVPR
jgi:hypothetical protein